MSAIETLLSVAATRTGAAVAGLTLAAGSLGVASAMPQDASDHVPDDAAQQADQADHGEQDRAVQLEQDDRADVTVEQDEDVPGTSEEAPVAEAEGDDEGVSADVHAAQTGDEDLAPGDPGFGEAVSANAREDGAAFGAAVSEAARQGHGDDEQAEDDEHDADAHRPDTPAEGHRADR